MERESAKLSRESQADLDCPGSHRQISASLARSDRAVTPFSALTGGVLATWLVRLSRRAGIGRSWPDRHPRQDAVIFGRAAARHVRAGWPPWRGEGGITGLVDRVERRGLVERTPIPADRRAAHVRLTTAGKQAAVGGHKKVRAELDGLASELPPAERERLRRSLARILARSEHS